MDVGAWLRGLGLGQYEAAFRENDIDGEVLPDLTAEDLAGLGVASIGHRRKLLAAVAALREGPRPVQIAPAPDRAKAAPPAEGVNAASGERRQLTIMFCDVVGSTELATRLDPEDLRDVIGAYQRAAAETLGRFGGFVAKYMGDGILAYFGYPEAHEDDAERAVRAGLAIIAAVGRLGLRQRLELRLGIATGLVVVGDLIGAGAAQERGVVGETPNLAARLQSLAEPNGIVIDEGTRRQIGTLFELRPLGPQTLKGFGAATEAWQAVGESAVASRFEALRSRTTPLVGREEELELLERRWMQAKKGEGRVVLLSAEPGIGKSRLTEALAERIAAEPHYRLRYFCSPHHQDSAFHPIVGQIEHAAGFAREDDAAQKRRKLAALLGDAGEDVPVLAELLSLPAERTGAAPELTPQRKKEMTFEALLRRMETLARERPLLMVFEDLHWMDATSRELLDRTIARVERLPVLLIATLRPEFQPPWVGQPQVTMLSLSRLGRREGAALVERLAGNAGALPADVIEEIVERTDGVPLFLEEVTKVILESGSQAREAASAIPGTRTAVPATLQASLMARLDRLGPVAREIAQTGAAIGRDFSYDLLMAVAQRGEAEVLGALDRLVAAGLVFQRGTPPAAEYQFKHALVQDTAYGTLLRGPRQALHGRIAAAIETQMPDRIEREPELLAYHLSEAGQRERAAPQWRKAGEKAVRRAANREAIEHFRRALAPIETLPEGEARWREELAIVSQLALPLMNVYGWSSAEVGETVERAAAVGRKMPSSRELAPAVANLWIFNTACGRMDRAEEISRDLFRIARELGDEEVLLQAHHSAWATEFILGRLREAAEHVDAGAALYDEQRHAHHRHLYLGHDPRTCGMNFGAVAHTAFGSLDRGLGLVRDAMTLGRRIDHVASRTNTLWRGCEVFMMRRDIPAVLETATELVELATAHGIPIARANGLLYLGWARMRMGDVAEGTARLSEGRSTHAAVGFRLHGTLSYGFYAECLSAAGRHLEGLDALRQAQNYVEETKERSYVSWLHRLRATLALRAFGSDAPQVEAELRQAIESARQQGTKFWELEAAADLARLWGERGRRGEAGDLLRPLYDWFSEGLDTPPLRDAKGVLGALGA